MKYRVNYTTADGRSYHCDGGVFSCYSSPPEVLRVVRAVEKFGIRYGVITLVEPMQKGGTV